MAFVAFLAAILSGWLLVRLTGPARGMRPRWAAVVLEAALGAGAGAGLFSFLYFGLLLMGAASAFMVLLADAVVLLLLAFLVRWRRVRTAPAGAPDAGPNPPYRWTWLLVLVFGACLLPVLLTFMEVVQANPYGDWDAWAIWNLRAKYLAGPGETWRYAVSPLLTLTHPDYPLLTSGFIAHAWKAGGGQPTTTIPIATALLFSGSALALLVASLALLRGPSLGLLAGMVVLANVPFLKQLSVAVCGRSAGVLLSRYAGDRVPRRPPPRVSADRCWHWQASSRLWLHGPKTKASCSPPSCWAAT